MKSPARHQQGAALIVGLVLLMVLTLLAVSTMRTASLELMMAGNTQSRANAFQFAEAGIETALRQLDDETIVPEPTDDWQAAVGPVDVTVDGQPVGRYDATVRFDDAVEVWGGWSAGEFGFWQLRVESNGRTLHGGEETERSGRARLVQGVVMPGPRAQLPEER